MKHAPFIEKQMLFTNLGMARIDPASSARMFVTSFFGEEKELVSVSLAVICSSDHLGSIASASGSMPSGWIFYSYSHTATQTLPTLSFAFEIHGDHQYYLDEVSVTDNNGSSVELLKNPSFDQSSTDLTAWKTSCETTCRTALVADAQCSNSSGTCLLVQCTDGLPSPIFVSQSFVATIGHTYSISYALREARATNIGRMSFYVDVI